MDTTAIVIAVVLVIVVVSAFLIFQQRGKKKAKNSPNTTINPDLHFDSFDFKSKQGNSRFTNVLGQGDTKGVALGSKPYQQKLPKPQSHTTIPPSVAVRTNRFTQIKSDNKKLEKKLSIDLNNPTNLKGILDPKNPRNPRFMRPLYNPLTDPNNPVNPNSRFNPNNPVNRSPGGPLYNPFTDPNNPINPNSFLNPNNPANPMSPRHPFHPLNPNNPMNMARRPPGRPTGFWPPFKGK